MPQKIPLLKVKDNEGNSVPVPALQGPPGGVDSVCGHQGNVDLTVSGALELDKTNANMALSHKEAAGYRHLPAGGSAGQILRGAGDGSGEWVDFTAGENYFPMAAGTTTGMPPDYQLTLSPPLTSYSDGILLYLKFHQGYSDGLSVTLNINGLGAKPILTYQGTYAIGLSTGQAHLLLYQSNSWYILDNAFLPVFGGMMRGSILPAATGAFSLGEPSRQWENIYATMLTIGNSPVADFVVEQGISGYWTYRKWNSGTAEAWCTRSITLNLSTQFGYVYAGQNESIDLPNGLFSSTDGMYVQLTGNNLWTASCDIKAVNALTIKFFSGHKYENSVGSYDVYVKGRWK
jgi:hypothetical protein